MSLTKVRTTDRLRRVRENDAYDGEEDDDIQWKSIKI